MNASSGDCFHIVAPSLLILTFLRGKFGFAVRTVMFDIMKPICESACTVVSRRRTPYGFIPQFCLDFLLRSKSYLKERPPSTSIANRDFPLSSKPESVVRLVYTHYKVQILLLPSGLHYYKVLNPRCHALFAPLLALSSTQY